MKKGVAVILALSLSLAVVGCSSGKDSEPKKDGNGEVVEEVVDETTEETEPEIVAESVNVGDTVSLPFAEFVIDSFEVENDGYYFSYQESNGGISVTHNTSLEPSSSGVSLVCLRGTFTNNSGVERYPSNNPMYGVMTINGNEYRMSMRCYICDEAESQMSLIAGLPVDCFFYAEVPTNIASSIDTCEVTFGFLENLEPGYVAGIESLDYVYSLEAIPN